MGGKTKAGQRTKNNTKPSSSSRSAELLRGVTDESAPQASFLQTVTPFAGIENLLDSVTTTGLNLTMRKLIKKDPITRRKALQEFIEILNDGDLEDIKSILPIWSKLFSQLAYDESHNNRELFQMAHQVLASRCKRTLAPYLKQIVAVWLSSHFDSFGPAANIASNSFQETFGTGTNRIPEVCLYCQSEILENLTNELSISYAKLQSSNKSSNKTFSESEEIGKNEHQIFRSLKTLSFFLESTKSLKLSETSSAKIQKLLKDKHFWKLPCHKKPTIRAAWFELASNMMVNQSVESILENMRGNLIRQAFEHLDESDFNVVPQLWRCILLLQSKYENWHCDLDFDSFVIPKLAKIFDNLFYNNETIICPNLLAFFSNIDILDTKCDLREPLFDNFKKVFHKLSTRTTGAKQVECSVIFKAYFECLQYVFKNILTAQEQEKSVALLNDKIIALIEWSFTCKSLVVEHLYKYTLEMVEQWIARCNQLENDNNEKSQYTKLLNDFWKSINHLIIKYIETQEGTQTDQHLVENMIKLIQCIANREEKLCIKNNDTIETDRDSKLDLSNLGIKLIQLCINNILQHKSFEYIHYMHRLLTLHKSIEFYRNVSKTGDITESLNVFISVLNISGAEHSGVLLDIIFDTLQFVPKDQRLMTIKAHMFGQPKEIQILIFNRMLTCPPNFELEVQALLYEPEVTDLLIDLVNDILNKKSFSNLELLEKCFCQTDNSKINFPPSTLDSLLNILSDSLDISCDDEVRSYFVNLLSKVMPNVFQKNTVSKATLNKVFIKLFKLSLENKTNKFIMAETLNDIKSHWLNAINNKYITIDENILLQCKEIVDSLLIANAVNNEVINRMSDIVIQLILSLNETTLPIESCFDRIRKVFLHTKCDILEAEENLKQLCLYLEVLKYNISLDYEVKETSVKEEDLIRVFKSTLLTFHITHKLSTEIYTNVKNQYKSNTDISNVKNCLVNEMIKCIETVAAGERFVKTCINGNTAVVSLITELSTNIISFWIQDAHFVKEITHKIIDRIFIEENVSLIRAVSFLESSACAHWSTLNVVLDDVKNLSIPGKSMKPYVYCLQYFQLNRAAPIIPYESVSEYENSLQFWMKSSVLRTLAETKLSLDVVDIAYQTTILSILNTLTAGNENKYFQRDLLYDTDMHEEAFADIRDGVEFIKLLTAAVKCFPESFCIKHWDAIRIGLSSWVLTVSKSIDKYALPKVAYFVVSVYKLYFALMEFINSHKTKSSNKLIDDMVDEWERLFKYEVNVILFKSFYNLCLMQDSNSSYDFSYKIIYNEIQPAIMLIDYEIVYKFCQKSHQITLNNVSEFCLAGISSSIGITRSTSLYIVKKLTDFFVKDDINHFDTENETFDQQNYIGRNHYLQRFESYINDYGNIMKEYLNEFDFKESDMADFEEIDCNEAMSYLMFWDCIIYACSKTSSGLRPIYTTWLQANLHEETILHFLFRAMPIEVLKNYDSKIVNMEIFKELTLAQIIDKKLSLDKYVCHLYTTMLKTLPVIVRKWWSSKTSRAKTFITKLTSTFVSPLIYTEQLKTLAKQKDKLVNMQVTVHISTREVMAIYAFEDSQMELVITLPPNYPLSAVKIDCVKQIGGRHLMRNIAMQLALFLTHQNGTLFDGLTIWKNNLDKRFEGLEECYICYTVIHQETCQLPKLSCRTCKKKFHAHCLYKWFTTSSKSTCPICRHIF